MMDFKKAISFAYDNVKWYYLLFIFVLAILYMIGDLFTIEALSTITVFLILLYGAGIIGTKIAGKLKTFKQAKVAVHKNTGMFTVIAIIYFIAQLIMMFIGIFIIGLIVGGYNSYGELTDPANLESLLFSLPIGILLLILFIVIVFIIAIIILELIKTMAAVKYFKTNKFGDVFKIGKYFKAIFTLDYLTIIIFVLGAALIGITIVSLIYALIVLFSLEVATAITNILAVLFIYTITGISYSLISDYLDKK